MAFEVVNGGGFASLRVKLKKGQSVKAQSGNSALIDMVCCFPFDDICLSMLVC